MKSTLRVSIVALALGGLAACATDDAPPAGPALAVDVAALNLAGVGDVVWDLEVRNGATTPETVWQRRVTSSGYGDGAGSASYIGTCDADQNPNVVRVWVVGVYSAAVTSAGSFNSGSTDGVGAVTGTPTDFQNPTTDGPLTQSVTCAENTDVAVQFDVALMRPAQQGFFDIAVNFNNICCSAKFDCCDDDDDSDSCDAGEDIELLFTAGSGRGRTMVLGFACTAGTGAPDDTTLYMDPIAFDCTDPASGFTADFTVDPGAGAAGNQCTAGDMAGCAVIDDPAPAEADTYLFQVGVYRGDELLTDGSGSAHKVYWNVALGVTGSIGDCALRTSATADDDADDLDGLVDGVVTLGAVYPYVTWDVPLGACASEPLTFDGTGPVTTTYTGTGDSAATTFAYGFAPGLPPAPVCSAPCLNGGTCTAPDTCTCVGGYSGDQCENLAAESCLVLRDSGITDSGVYTIDPNQDDNPIEVYCDMDYDGGGWTLIGKGRQGWGSGASAFPTAGLGTLSDLANNPDTATVAAMPSSLVQAITDSANLNALTDGILVHRHDCSFDTYRIEPQVGSPFDWRVFFSQRHNGGPAGSYSAYWTRYSYMTTSQTIARGSGALDDNLYTYTGNDCSRLFTANWSSHNANGGGTGWSGGSGCGGSGCWEYSGETHGINRVTVFVRE